MRLSKVSGRGVVNALAAEARKAQNKSGSSLLSRSSPGVKNAGY